MSILRVAMEKYKVGSISLKFEAGQYIYFGRGPMVCFGIITKVEESSVYANVSEVGCEAPSEEVCIKALENIRIISKEEFDAKQLARSEYEDVTPLDWAEYEFATIEYDYRIHPDAAKAIRSIFKRLADK